MKNKYIILRRTGKWNIWESVYEASSSEEAFKLYLKDQDDYKGDFRQFVNKHFADDIDIGVMNITATRHKTNTSKKIYQLIDSPPPDEKYYVFKLLEEEDVSFIENQQKLILKDLQGFLEIESHQNTKEREYIEEIKNSLRYKEYLKMKEEFKDIK